MVQYITTLSKYFIAIAFALYTLECFLVFKFKNENTRKGVYRRQIVLIILIHFFCFLPLCINKGEIKYLISYAVFQVLILLIIEVLPMIYKNINRLLINNTCLLLSVGLIMLLRFNFNSFVKQLVIVFVSFLLASFIPFLMKKLKSIPNTPYIYATLGIVLLTFVYLFGSLTHGSKISISIFGMSFMPSEFIKILFVFFIAGSLERDKSFKNLVLTTVFAALHVILLAASNDLGAALIYYVIYVILVFVATRNYWYLLLGSSFGVGFSVLAYNLFRHVQVRVSAFIDPFSVIDNEGYQITQSLFAIGSGSWFGLGLNNGTPESIPYVETDFIFSAISQEMGIVLGICLLLVCLSCFVMFINISLKINNQFYRLISIGLSVTYIFQVFLTVGGGTKFIPLTGVTLPLVSLGGSSVMATIFVVFIIEGMYINRNNDEFKEVFIDTQNNFFKKQSNIIMGITYFNILTFLALGTYLCIYVSTHKEELINNTYNPVQEILINSTVRGNIYSRDKIVLATTQEDRNGNETRLYPFYNIFSHTIGYSTNGRAGVEALANYYLINSNQPVSEKMGAEFKGEKYKGDGVITTLDVNLQKVAYSAMGTYNGAVIVTNPKTGEILSMVSKPDFDPNEIDEIWDDLLKDENSSVLLNRATQGLYPPGSTFKILTLLEFIRENPEDYIQYNFSCDGKLDLKEGSIECFNHQKHGYVTLRSSFAKSCNSSFGNIGLKLDREKYQKTLEDCLFNKDLPLTMSYAKSSVLISEDYDDITMVRTAFGQGSTLMTPMHINLITQAIANGGMLMKPYIVSSVVNSNLNTVKEFEPEEYKQLMSATEADIIKDMMESVVTEGTGKKLKNKDYSVAGKTGSAEYSDSTNLTHSWFTGFAPLEDPEICVTVILESAGSGNIYATPVAKKIFNEYFGRFIEGEIEDYD